MILTYLQVSEMQEKERIDNREQIKYSRGVERAEHLKEGRPSQFCQILPYIHI